MSAVAAVLVCVALGALAVFQALLVAGAPLGRFAKRLRRRRVGPPFALSPGALSASMMLSSGGAIARIDRLERG